MYDYDYEYDILGVLRLLRYLHMYKPDRAAALASGETAFTADDVLEFLYYSTEELFDDCFTDYDEMNGSETMYIYDRAFDDYLDLNAELFCPGSDPTLAIRRKFEDAVCFFLADRNCGIFDMTIRYEDDSPQIRLEFAEGYCEPSALVMVLTDMMHYLQRENEHMRQIIEKRSTAIISLPQNYKEAA